MTSQKNKQDEETANFFILLFFSIFVAFNINKCIFPDLSLELNRMKYNVKRAYGLSTNPSKKVLDREAEIIAQSYGLDPNLFRALIRVESGIDASAVSPVGARGIAQIMPFNAKRCGLADADKLFDATHNLRCGAQILSEEIKEHGDVHKALTVYNCGRVRCPAGKRYASKVIGLSKRL